jgi:hypothetical protein
VATSAVGNSDVTSMNIIRPSLIRLDRVLKEKLVEKPIPSFPMQSDRVLARELADHKSASMIFEGADLDPLLYMNKLVEATESLRCRYLGINRWFVVATTEEKLAFEKAHHYNVSGLPVRFNRGFYDCSCRLKS